MSASENIWRMIKLLGVGEPNRKLRTAFYNLFSVYMLFQTILACFKRWNNIKHRYNAIEDIQYTPFTTIMILENTLFSKNLYKLTGMMDEKYYTNYPEISEVLTWEKQSYIISENKTIHKELNTFCFILGTSLINFAVPCYMIAYYKILTHNDEKKLLLEDLILPYESWYPFEPANLIFLYTAITIYSSYYVILLFLNTYCTIASTTGSMKHVRSEIRLLQLSVKHLRYVSHQVEDSSYIALNGYDQLNSVNEWCLRTMVTKTLKLQAKNDGEEILKQYINHIVIHHNIILRNIRTIGETISLNSMNFNNVALTTTSMGIYWMTEADNNIDRMCYAFTLFAIIAMLFIYFSNGQMIQTEGEKLRDVLYECSWIDRPNWFKKAYLIIMVRATKPLELKPLGIYVLNFSSFTSILNAAYSFANILRTFKTRNHI